MFPSHLNIPEYKIAARKDRTDTLDSRGGGLLIYYRIGLLVSEEESSSEFNQLATVSILTQSQPLLIHLIYRSPNSSASNNAKLNEFIKSIDRNSLIVGDMNYREIDWENGSSDSEGREFFNTCQDKFLDQNVSFPTHGSNILDLVLSNNTQVLSVDDAGNLGKSKHSILHGKVDLNPKQSPTSENVLDYSKADFSKLKEKLSAINWNTHLNGLSTEDSWTFFTEKLNAAIEDCIPLKKRRSPYKPLWMNRNILRLIRKKRRLWRYYKTTSDYRDYQSYLEVQKSVTKVIRNAKKRFERKLAKNFKSNPRQFYSHLNSKTKSRTAVGPLNDQDDELISDSQGMCNILNGFFASVFTVEDTLDLPNIQQT